MSRNEDVIRRVAPDDPTIFAQYSDGTHTYRFYKGGRVTRHLARGGGQPKEIIGPSLREALAKIEEARL